MGSRTAEGYRTLGAFLRRQRGHRSLREMESLSRSCLFIGQPGVVSASAINSVENGFQKPSVETLLALASIYGVPFQRLLAQVRLDRAPAGGHPGRSFQEFLARSSASARSGDWAAASAAAHRAVEMASSPGERSRALEALGIALLGSSRPAEAVGALHEALHDAGGEPERELSLGYHLALAHREAGNLRMASAVIRTLRRTTALQEALAGAAHVHLLAAGLELRRAELPWLLELEGDVTEPAREAVDAASRARSAFRGPEYRDEQRESAVLEGAAQTLAGEAGLGMGRLQAVLEEARAEHDLPGELRALLELGKTHLRERSPARGAELLRSAERIAARLGDHEAGFLASFHLVRATGTDGTDGPRNLGLLRSYRPLVRGWLLEARLADELWGARPGRAGRRAEGRAARAAGA